MRVLTVNAGSSSLKIRVLDVDDRVTGSFARLADFAASGLAVDAVAHRVVHGGHDLVGPVLVDALVERRLAELTELAPLHQPPALAAIDEARRLLPALPHVACFDTAFHAGLPAPARTYALPKDWIVRYGLRRFGFHGLSHAWIARRTAELLPRARRVVSCHLGAGASLCAVLDGRSVDTTMGFTPVDGLVMATRSGAVDPGLVTYLAAREPDVARTLELHSGLVGLAGDPDLRVLLDRTDPDARLAVGVYQHRLRAGIAAMAAAMGGLDACVFTGGVGEHLAPVRRDAVEGLGFLGLELDVARNDAAQPDTDLSTDGAAARTLLVAAREDLELAREARTLLGDPCSGPPT